MQSTCPRLASGPMCPLSNNPMRSPGLPALRSLRAFLSTRPRRQQMPSPTLLYTPQPSPSLSPQLRLCSPHPSRHRPSSSRRRRARRTQQHSHKHSTPRLHSRSSSLRHNLSSLSSTPRRLSLTLLKHTRTCNSSSRHQHSRPTSCHNRSNNSRPRLHSHKRRVFHTTNPHSRYNHRSRHNSMCRLRHSRRLLLLLLSSSNSNSSSHRRSSRLLPLPLPAPSRSRTQRTWARARSPLATRCQG